MALKDRIYSALGIQSIQNTTNIDPRPEVNMLGAVPVKTIEVGSTGTEIYGGYLSEEYLSELRGREFAEKIDMMRRSDANIKMILNALKSPLKSSNWFIEKTDDSELAEMQKLLIEKALFEDINKSFTRLLGEILTFVDFGYSLFDITHKPVLNDKKIGPHNTLKSISYRSQKTIERWNVLPDGTLMTVSQIAYGDLGKTVDLDARFLLHFAPDQEGDNFEGVSVLRSSYGAWFRKNVFLRLIAAGTEKYAIPTPVLNVPEGASGKPEFANAERALQCYTSGQANYLILPIGYSLTFNNVNFDSEKVSSRIKDENQEMVNSVLASFLLLGQNGAGSLALANELSDFFAQTVTYLADHIIEQFDRKIIRPLIAMNFGDVECLVELKTDSLADKATTEWANIVKSMSDAGLITKNKELEDHIRAKMKLPELSDEEASLIKNEQITEQVANTPKQLAEKKKQKINNAYPKLIRDSAKTMRELGQEALRDFAFRYISNVMSKMKQSTDAAKIKAPINANVPSINDYVSAMQALAMITILKTDEIVEKQFSKKQKKLSEYNLAATKLSKVQQAIADLEKAMEQLIKSQTKDDKRYAMKSLGDVSSKVIETLSGYLSNNDRQRAKAKSEVFAETQKQDVIKAIDLSYQTNLNFVDDDALEFEMTTNAIKTIDGPITTTGPDIQGSQLVNDSIETLSKKYEEETGDKILSYTFVAVDDDVTTELCSELDGSVFSPDDPDLKKYTCPLHWNCRSYLEVNTTATGSPEITGAPKLSKKAQSQLVLKEKKKKPSKKT